MRRRIEFVISLVALLGAAPSRARADDAEERLEFARAVVESAAEKKVEAYDFGAKRAWLNVSRPLTLKGDLKGKVVVLDFWCYCCINCLHILPDLAFLERKYEGKAVAVVGVHSAKFANEKDVDHIREAVVRNEIRHPVVDDSDFDIWNHYGAEGWPHFVVVSPTGHVLDAMGGEGHRNQLDALITAALEYYGASPGVLDTKPLPIALERATRPATELAYPGKLAADENADRLWISDSNHHRIVETTLAGKFLRAFGDGEPGFVDGAASKARFHRPQGLAVGGGALFVADTENHAIRRIELSSGAVTTIAGTGKQGGVGEGEHPTPGIALSSPWDLAFVGDFLLVAMAGNHQIWRLSPTFDKIAVAAGDGTERKKDGFVSGSAFAQPSGLATDGRNLFVADSESSSVRQITQAFNVSTLAGANDDADDLFNFGLKDGTKHGAKFQHPLGVAFLGGLVWVADTYNHAIRTIDPKTGATKTVFGNGTAGSTDDPARFSEPSGFAVVGDRLFVADSNNHRIRIIDTKTLKVSTLVLTGVPIPQAAAKAAGVSKGDAWPTLPDTAKSTAPVAKLKAGVATTLRVRIDLPAGWHLTEGAPSSLRVDGLSKAISSPVTDVETAVSLPVVGADVTSLRVRALFYVCQDGGSCRVRSIDVTLPVSLAADGATDATITDTFAP